MSRRKNGNRYVLCVKQGAYKVSLERRKVYRCLEDKTAEADGYLRIVDESGEDYLYPAGLFVPVAIPKTAQKALRLAS